MLKYRKLITINYSSAILSIKICNFKTSTANKWQLRQLNVTYFNNI